MRRPAGWIVLVAAIAACGDNADVSEDAAPTVDAAPSDAGSDAGSDATVDATMPDAPPSPAALSARVGGLAITGWSYGDRATGSTELTTFAITNDGAAAVSIVASLADADPAFAIDAAASTCDDQQVAADASCDVAVRFAPTTAGDKTATLRLAVEGQLPVTLALTGRALVGLDLLSFDPDDHSFGPIEIGLGASIPITVTNGGTTTATVSAVDVGGAGFTRVSTTCVGTLAPTASCQVVVRFAPTFVGVAAGTVVVTTATGTATTGLAGTGAGRITVTRSGAGAGTIVSAPAGISCPGTCSALFTTPVTLTATADTGSRVIGFSTPCGSGTTCAIVPAITPTTVDVRFEVAGGPTRVVTVTTAGAGLGQIEIELPDFTTQACIGQCSYTVATGATVIVQAVTPSVFTGWTGACTGALRTCTLEVLDDAPITATFDPNPGSVWARLLPLPQLTFPGPRIAFAPDGDLLLATATALTRFDTAGAIRWTVTLPVLTPSEILGVAAAGDGSLFVLRRSAAGQRLDKLDLAGGPVWNRTVAAQGGISDSHTSHLSVNTAGVAVVSANVTVFEASGDLRWAKPAVFTTGVAIGPDGTVYVAIEDPTSPDDTELTAYDATGAALPSLGRRNGYHVSLAINAAGVVAAATSGHGNLAFWRQGGPGLQDDTNFAAYTSAGVAVDADGNLIAVRDRRDQTLAGFILRRIPAAGGAPWVIDRPISVGSVDTGASVRSVAADGSGRFAIAGEMWGYRTLHVYVEVFDPE